jgi:hypothetical protein
MCFVAKFADSTRSPTALAARHGPNCEASAAGRQLDAREADLLPVHYVARCRLKRSDSVRCFKVREDSKNFARGSPQMGAHSELLG